jgi:prolyl oligopeptidase
VKISTHRLTGALVALVSTLLSAQALQYPATKKVNQIDDYHGVKVADPYRWLEDDNSPDTAAWVKAENDVTFPYLEAIPFRK